MKGGEQLAAWVGWDDDSQQGEIVRQKKNVPQPRLNGGVDSQEREERVPPEIGKFCPAMTL